MRRPVSLLMSAAVAALPLAMLPAVASASDSGATYTAQLSPLNNSGASGTATVTELGNGQLRVEIQSSGLVAGQPHAQHIHFAPDARHECPSIPQDDNDGDQLISTPEGQPAYGGIVVSLTTTGDVGPGSALAVKRFPVGDTVTYSRTFDVPSGFDTSNLADAVIVQHGIDINNNGKYDLQAEIGESALKKGLPAEATFPATCGALSPAGGMATGLGGAAGGVDDAALFGLGGAALLGGGALLMLMRRRQDFAR